MGADDQGSNRTGNRELGKMEQKIDDIREDVGWIRSEISRICARVEDNTKNISKQRVLCEERVKNLDKRINGTHETQKLSISARATIVASLVAAFAAIACALLT